MLRFLIILLLIYLFFRLGKILLKWYLHKKIDSMKPKETRVNEKFKDAKDAEFTDIPDPDKNRKKDQ
jgi:hypothetical protein